MTDPLPTLYFVRHGETDWNRQGLIQGWRDIALNALGEAQARAVAKALRVQIANPETVDFFVSPMLRTRQTMGFVQQAFGLADDRILIDEDLKEQGFGVWEGKPHWELKASPLYPADPDTRYEWRPDGGESYADGQQRLLRWLGRVKRPCVVVSHGALGRCLIGSLTGLNKRDTMALRIEQGKYCMIDQGVARWFDGLPQQG